MAEKKQRVQLGAESVPDSQWRRFHKITPVAQLGAFWVVLVAVAFSMLQNFVQTAEDWKEIGAFAASKGFIFSILLISLGILVISLLIVLFAWLGWRKMNYAIVDSGIHLRRGIFFVSHTQMRWDRVQTVDVEQTLFGRIFGFGSVKVSSAGNDEDIKLGLLRLRDCAKLRKEILRILNLVRSGLPFSQAEAIVADTAGRDPEVELTVKELQAESEDGGNAFAEKDSSQEALHGGMRFLSDDDLPVTDADQNENDFEICSLPVSRLIGATLLSSTTIAVLFVAIPTVVFPIVFDEGYIVILFAALGLIWSTVKSLFDEYGTKIFLSENGLRRRSGLTTLKTRTYPPQRIHAVQIHQPILWRHFDWWKINAIVAGASNAEDLNEFSGQLMFAASRNDAVRLLWTILPRLGSENDARLLDEAMEGSGTGEFFQGASKRAKIFDPIALPGRGFFASKEVLIIRKGRWGRTLTFLLQDHTQSMSISRGPLAARRGIASLGIHMVAGTLASSLDNFDLETITQLLHRELALTTLARKEGVSETLQEWKERVGVAASASGRSNSVTQNQ